MFKDICIVLKMLFIVVFWKDVTGWIVTYKHSKYSENDISKHKIYRSPCCKQKLVIIERRDFIEKED